MKLRILSIILLCAGVRASAFAQGGAEVVTNTINGTLTFNNSNPTILNWLNAPGNEGMSNLLIYADSVPSGRSTISPWQDTSTRTNGDYEVVVDCNASGVPYRLAPATFMDRGQETYWFNATTSPPVVANVAGPRVDFSECLGAVNLNFVTADGAPAPVSNARLNASRTADGSASATLHSTPSGSTSQRVYLEGGHEHRLDIYLTRGSDPYTDRQVHFVSTNITIGCDQIIEVNILFPPDMTFGSITGIVDVLREFEWSVEGYNQPQTRYPDYTSVVANYGPFQNERWDALPGDNLVVPSSGAFKLINVAPSTSDPSSPGYAMAAVMLFRTNRATQYLGTPGLGWGSNAAVVVTPGATVNLSNIFVIDPGYLRGTILLQGPPETPARASQFRGLLRAGDYDTDGDGLPDAVGTYGIYYSSIVAEGVDRRAAGARYTAAHGYGYAGFDGTFDNTTSAFRGSYELALGGLQGERSLWEQSYLNLTLSSGAVTTNEDYYDIYYSILDRGSPELEIAPNQAVTKDVAYCFSEVVIRFHSESASFYSPQVRFYDGVFTNADFQGQPANYTIGSGVAYGTPSYPSEATNRGQVVMFLPQGNYTFYPSVIPGEAASGLTGLEPISLSVPCGQRLGVEPCLQMGLNIPGCNNSSSLTLTGLVRTLCTNPVVEITYELNGGVPVTICNDCGLNPGFGFTVLLAAGENRLKVTAHDNQGGVTFVEGILRPDSVPPVIQCPNDITTNCDAAADTVVNFTVTATDNCDDNVSLVCTPPSGSAFAMGETTVICTATDAAKNSSQCSFKVTVNPGRLSIKRAVIVRWDCGGILQYADDLAGPWTDIPGVLSPYAVAANEAHRYYRTRQ